ncbi:hypothetical protein [uncultured Sphingomonas sp.]|uniref:hypothetical protein n=1 Tax=uncultured Sphingomonas sp. TaxID=158754 RepID=UPI0025E462EA|nr:hypothetical protein [uncultured Sphingomonas sp.]
MFGWFRKRAARPQPETRWIVALALEHVAITDAHGGVRRLALTDLRGVTIETNDSGPWGTDVWWLLFGADDRLACAFPQGATGEAALLDYLCALPGFDFAAMGRAMGSTDNAVFPVWRKDDAR